MNTVIVYDITNNKTRTRLHKFLRELGIRSQRSVFECRIDSVEIREIRKYCLNNLDLTKDSLRIYRVCSRCMNKAILQGQGVKFSQLDWCII
jgi:CRISPR-associated protein Cas2